MDPDLLGNLLDQHAAALELYARQWCDAPEDVVQEAFLKLAGLGSLPSSPAAWLFRVVRNGAIDAGLAARRRRRHESAAASGSSPWFEPEGDERPGELDPEIAAGELQVAADRGARGHRRSSLGWTDLRTDRRIRRLFLEHGAPVVRPWPDDTARAIGGTMSQVPTDPELSPIESALGKLTPARSRIDRDRVMFQAGVLHARADSRRRWVWPSIAATLAVVALSESVALAVRPGPRVIVVQRTAPAPESRPPEPEPVQILSQSDSSAIRRGSALVLRRWRGALRCRRQVLRFGVEGLPDPPSLLSQSDVSGCRSTQPRCVVTNSTR